MFRLVIVAVLLVPVVAHAEIALPQSNTVVHLTAGAELLGGSGAMSGGFRGRALIGRSFGTSSMRPLVAVGGTFGSGSLSVSDMRALDGTLTLNLTTLGPEAQVGLRFARGGFVDNRVYASFAVLHVNKDRRLALDDVAGVSESNRRGYRAAVGASWMGSLIEAWTSEDHERNGNMADVFLIAMPSQAEIAWERDAGSARYGVMLGWGI